MNARADGEGLYFGRDITPISRKIRGDLISAILSLSVPRLGMAVFGKIASPSPTATMRPTEKLCTNSKRGLIG